MTRYLLYQYDRRARVWRFDQAFTQPGEAAQHADMYRRRGRRVRLMIQHRVIRHINRDHHDNRVDNLEPATGRHDV